MTSRALSAAIAAATLLCALCRVAGADDASSARALALFNEGKDLDGRGDYAAACSRFAESAELDARVGTFARLADCEEKRGLLLSARSHWGTARDLARTLHDPRAEHAATEYERVDARVPKVRLTLRGPPPAGLTIAIDGSEVGAAALDAPWAVEAGAHTIRAAAPGRRPQLRTVTTAPDGAVTEVPLDLGEAGPATAPSGAAPIADAGWNGQRTAALVAGGFAVAAAGVGTYFGLRTFSDWSSARDACGAACAPNSQAFSSKSDAETAAVASDTAFAVAGVALVTAVALWVTARHDGSGGAGALRVAPIAGSAFAGLTILGALDPPARP